MPNLFTIRRCRECGSGPCPLDTSNKFVIEAIVRGALTPENAKGALIKLNGELADGDVTVTDAGYGWIVSCCAGDFPRGADEITAAGYSWVGPASK